jgi:hypothetical protein
MKKLQLLGLMVFALCMITSKSFAQDYQQVNIFNRFTDWTVTLGKGPEDKQRIINERIDLRAKNREAWDHRRSEEKRISDLKDQESRDYEKHKMDLQGQYKDDQDTMNKKLQEAENDHNTKMNDLDNQWKANEGR